MFGWIRKHIMLVFVLLLIFGGAGLYIGITVADQPFFCGLACHEMQPHVDTLAANFHGKHGVTCMDCHSEQGFWHHTEEHILASMLVIPHITKVYLNDEHTNFHADVPGFNPEEWDFKDKNPSEQKEIFKECRRCHPNRLDLSYFMFAPDSKYELITHNCKRCHKAIAKQAEGDTEKAKTALYKEGINAPRALPNVHPLHLGMHIYCNRCHSRVVHNNDPGQSPMAMHDCTSCHDGEQAPFEDCKTCHVGIKKIFEGNTGRGVEETASPMLEIECLDCHNAQREYAVNTQTCVDCHEDESYAGLVSEWQGSYNSKFTEATKVYNEVKEKLALAQRKGKEVSSIISIFKDGEYNYKLAALDGSHGVHNAEYTTPLLERAIETFQEVNTMMETTLQF